MIELFGFEAGKPILPLIFAILMGVSLLIYVILDGYDLGVGILLHKAPTHQQDKMVSSIGPFWDANETWLVLGIGLLLTAFPKAHGYILTQLYGPVTLMLLGLILRGVSFDFRTKAPAHQKSFWTKIFQCGSFIATFSQGIMLGRYISGFNQGLEFTIFQILVAISLVFGYSLLGACWVHVKCEVGLKEMAKQWGRTALIGTSVGLATISVVTPFVSRTIFDRWFSWPLVAWLSPIPLLTVAVVLWLWTSFKVESKCKRSTPFFLAGSLMTLAFLGLAVSILPYIVVDKLTIWEAAVSEEALQAIGIGAAIVLPAIFAYTLFVYWIFRGTTDSVEYP